MESIHFFAEPISVYFEHPPTLVKRPHCPDGFTWRGQEYRVTERLAEWSNFTRRGDMARNMRPEHAITAASRGSRNVGRFYFRVRTDTGQVFDLYYDRAIKDLDHRQGVWTLYRELGEE